MDKKLLADFSRIIRDIESKNLYKEADILNNCLVRLAQVSDDIATDSNTQTDLDALVDTTVQNSQPNTTNQQPAPSQTPAETASYSPELLIKINDLQLFKACYSFPQLRISNLDLDDNLIKVHLL